MSSHDADAAGVVRPDKVRLQQRLRRIGGQVEGVARMIDEDRYCVDVLTQVAAIRSALDAFALQVMKTHAHGCLQEAIRSGNGDRAIDELMTVVERLAR
jgi:DNA-binding FrmR family transcriptional regulator